LYASKPSTCDYMCSSCAGNCLACANGDVMTANGRCPGGFVSVSWPPTAYSTTSMYALRDMLTRGFTSDAYSLVTFFYVNPISNLTSMALFSMSYSTQSLNTSVFDLSIVNRNVLLSVAGNSIPLVNSSVSASTWYALSLSISPNS